MDGFKATRKIKKYLKKNLSRDIKIIAITANDSTFDKNHCFKNGMDFYLAKPVSRNELGTYYLIF